MYIEDFPNCCKASVICDFGGGHVGQVEGHTKQQVIDWVKRKIDKKYNTDVIFYANPTSAQPNAIAALEELGFYGHPNPQLCESRSAKNHLILPYFISSNEFNLKDFNARYDPKKDKYVNQKNNGVDQVKEDRRGAHNPRYW